MDMEDSLEAGALWCSCWREKWWLNWWWVSVSAVSEDSDRSELWWLWLRKEECPGRSGGSLAAG